LGNQRNEITQARQFHPNRKDRILPAKQNQSGLKFDEILDAALTLFHSKGYDATSVQDVAGSVGILKGSLYYYIDSKEDLLYGIISRVLNQLIPNLEQWRTLEGSGLQRITGFIEGYVLHIIANREPIGVMFRDYGGLSDTHRDTVLEMQRQYDTFLSELIIEGMSDGSVTADGDVGVTVNSIYGMANWTYRWYNQDGPLRPQDIATQVAALTRTMLSDAP
jgi:AcrR family transcriptional regulator